MNKEYHRQKSKEHYLENKAAYTARNILDKERRRQRKLKAISLFGGACCVCGYNKCPYALEFHHLEPKEKLFNIGPNLCFSWKKILVELQKCILLCSNCHKEVEYGELDTSGFSRSRKVMQIG